jgi:hypothetical protein
MKKPEPKEYVFQPKGWKKKYKCHKNKADHTFVVLHAHRMEWFKGNLFIEKQCSACGKKSIDMEPW